MIGERLKQARRASGMSTRALAERAGVSAMSISKYENDRAMPGSAVLLALAAALGVGTEFFFRTRSLALEAVDYRGRHRLSDRAAGQVEGEVLERVERWLELRDLMPGAPVVPFEVPFRVAASITDLGSVERAADAVRDAWDLGMNPIPDLIDTFEERGLLVVQTRAGRADAFDGLTCAVGDVAVIVVGSDWPGDRQRFTLAHELGHLVLGGRLATHIDPERAADRFAGAFLVPESEVRKELGERRTALEPAELLVLKHAYGLSMGGWLHRAVDLGVISAATYERHRRAFSDQGWDIREPGAQIDPDSPKLFEQLVFRARAEDLITDSKAAELLRITRLQFEARRQMVDATAGR